MAIHDPEIEALRPAARARARELRGEGLSYRQIHERLSGHFGVSTLHRWCSEPDELVPPPEPPCAFNAPGSVVATLPSLGPRPIGPHVWSPPPERPAEPPLRAPAASDDEHRAELRRRMRELSVKAEAGDQVAQQEEAKLALVLSRLSKLEDEPAELTETQRELDFSKLDDVEIEVYGALRRRASDDPDAHPLPNDASIIGCVTNALRASGILDKLGLNTAKPVGTPAKTPRKRARRTL